MEVKERETGWRLVDTDCPENWRSPGNCIRHDGRCWNASHLAPALAPGRLDESDELPLFDSGDTNPVGGEQPTAVTRPVRSRRVPAWTQDYVM